MTGGSFDQSKILPLFARIGEVGVPLVITFLNKPATPLDAPTPHPISAYDFKLPVKRAANVDEDLFVLTIGDGLEVIGDDLNKLEITLTAERSAQVVATNFWTLFSIANGNTVLNGPFHFHNGLFNGVEETANVYIGNTDVYVTIDNIVGGGGGETAEGTLVLLDGWDLSLDVVPQTGGTGTAGAIKKGNMFPIDVGSAGGVVGPDGSILAAGYMVIARIDMPGINLADRTKWLIVATLI